ncbi:hypothetical protein LguiA_020350 [Lonicera macranthoides]
MLVHGVEYAFGAHEQSTIGIFEVEQKMCPDFTFKKLILIGRTDMGPKEVHAFMEKLAVEYSGNTYNLITKNCNHFCNVSGFLRLLELESIVFGDFVAIGLLLTARFVPDFGGTGSGLIGGVTAVVGVDFDNDFTAVVKVDDGGGCCIVFVAGVIEENTLVVVVGIIARARDVFGFGRGRN